MDVNYLNPILDATNNVFQTMMQLETERGNVELREEIVTDNEANVIIGLTGDIEGSIVYSFSKEIALNIVNQMAGMEIDEIDKFVTSAIGEMANIISGKAATGLAEKNYECDIAPPQTVIGKDAQISTGTDNILSVKLNTEMGDFQVNFSMVKN
mgnify:CR=1 FL=1